MLTIEQVKEVLTRPHGKLFVTCYQQNGSYSILIHEKLNYSMADQFGIEVATNIKLKRVAVDLRQQTATILRSEGIIVFEEYVRLG